MGGAIDAEDGALPDAALEWFLDGVSLSMGKEIGVSGLEIGQYRVTLEATDSDDDTARESVTVYVGMRRIYLPIALKGQ